MKKLYLLFVFCCCISLVQAKAPWAGIVDPETQQLEKSPLLKDMLKGKVQVAVVLPSQFARKRAIYEDDVKQALQAWFAQAARLINQQGRTKEFADIYPKLSRPITVQIVPQAAYQVKFAATKAEIDEKCGEDGYACYSPQSHKIWMPVRPEDQGADFPKDNIEYYRQSFMHEFGHALGLDEQYEGATEKILINPAYSSSKVGIDSVMNKKSGIGCDDVDGLINLIDAQTVGKRSPLARGVWKSFCANSKDRYKDGKLVDHRKNKGVIESVGNGCWEVQGKTFCLNEHSSFQNWRKVMKQPLRVKSKQGRGNGIFYATGPNQEQVTCYKQFRKTWCAAFLNNQLVWVEEFGELSVGSEESVLLDYTLYFGGNGTQNYVSGYYENLETSPKLSGYVFSEKSSSPWEVTRFDMREQSEFKGNPNYMPVALRGLNVRPSAQRKNRPRLGSSKNTSIRQKQDSKQQRADEKVENLLTDFPVPCKQYLSW